MRGIRISILSTVLLAATAAAATPDYWPLEPGNQWIYRASGRAGSETLTIEVVRFEFAAGRAYAIVRGLAGTGEVWLRMDDDGTLYAYDPRASREEIWAAFSSAEGAEYATVVDPCNRRARIASRAARYSGPVGEFQREALRIAYSPGGCADAGITEEYYLPYVGMVQRTITTIAGPRTYDLIYARLGGIVFISERKQAFELALDRALYYADLMPPVDPRRAAPEMTARMTLRNHADTPIELNFASGQAFDLVLRDEAGKVAYRWSDGKAFTMALRRETLPPGREKNHVVLLRLADGEGKPLPQGRYTAEAWLTVTGPQKYSATLSFELGYAY